MRTRPIEVADADMLMERIGQGAPVEMMIREFTKNALDSGATRLHWGADPQWPKDHRGRKLSLVDNGSGMNSKELISYLGSLASSGRRTGRTEHFGVGAKITGVLRNPAGLNYQSWVGGKGAEVTLWRDPRSGRYGFRAYGDGHVAQLPTGYHPENPVDPTRSGTRVVFVGQQPEDDTTKLFGSNSNASLRRLRRAIDRRFFRLPDGVQISVGNHGRSNADNWTEQAVGFEKWVASQSEASGIVEVSGARVYWSLIKDEAEALSELGTETGIVFQDEVYDSRRGRDAIGVLQAAGLVAIRSRVAFYVEPSDEGTLQADITRTRVTGNNGELPWAAWCAQFKTQMPAPLAKAIREVSRQTQHVQTDKITRRLLERFPHDLLDRLAKVGQAPKQENGKQEQGRSSGRTGDERRQGGSGAEKDHGERKPPERRVHETPLEILERHKILPDIQWDTMHPRSDDPTNRTHDYAVYDYDSNTVLLDPNFEPLQQCVDRIVGGRDAALRPVAAGHAMEYAQLHVADAIAQVRISQVLGQISEATARERTSSEALSLLGSTTYSVQWGASRTFGNQVGREGLNG